MHLSVSMQLSVRSDEDCAVVHVVSINLRKPSYNPGASLAANDGPRLRRWSGNGFAYNTHFVSIGEYKSPNAALGKNYQLCPIGCRMSCQPASFLTIHLDHVL